MIKKICAALLLTAVAAGMLCGCSAANQKPTTPKDTEAIQPDTGEKLLLKIEIGEHVLMAELAQTGGAGVLEEKLYHDSLTVAVSNYGGFEKVGVIPWYLPSADEKITAKPGDIMLYNAQSVVLFYGENTWEYTRLGKILDCDAERLAQILGGDEKEMTLSLVRAE